MSIAKPRGRYFDDFEVGQEFESPARTVTQTDIINFACLSGDFNEVHTNFEYCKTTQFGEPIAHGPLVYAIMGGLQYASGINEGTLLALLQIDKWRLLDAVKHGDTNSAPVEGRRQKGKQQARPRRRHLQKGMRASRRTCRPGDAGDVALSTPTRIGRV